MTTTARATTRDGRSEILADARASFARKGLYRSRDDRLLGGVCAALGRRIQVRPGTARLLFVLVLMLLPGSQLLVYPVLWVLLPLDPGPIAQATRRRRLSARSSDWSPPGGTG